MKKCSKCRKDKRRSSFHSDSSRPDGLAAYCKPCKIFDVNRWKREHKSQVRAYNVKRWATISRKPKPA